MRPRAIVPLDDDEDEEEWCPYSASHARVRRAHTHTHTLAHTHARTRAMAILSLAVKLSGFGVGYLYPVYCSLKLLDRKSNTQDDYVLWLTYLIIAFTMVIAESWGVVLWYVLCLAWCAVSCSRAMGGARR